MNSDILCKLTISKRFPGKKMLLGLIVISFLVAVLALIPMKKDNNFSFVYNDRFDDIEYDDIYEFSRWENIFGCNVLYVDDGYEGTYISSDYWHEAGERAYESPSWSYYLYDNGALLFMSILLACFSLILFISLYLRSCIKKCDVSLFEDRIAGVQKRLFSRRSIDIPIEKLDSLYVKDSLFNKFLGGKTVAIKTSSSIISICGMENADEFVNLAMKQIKEYQQSVSTNTTLQGNNASSNDEFEKIQKLKHLLDQGIICQEEFEAKRNELMEKI